MTDQTKHDGPAPPADAGDDDARGADGAKVFLSYSRKDREKAQRISDALRAREYGVFRDTDDILPTEAWRERLQQLIEEADTIVFLMSRHSLTSEVCAWEVELADSLGKRIAPIVIEDVDSEAIPPILARLNYIFATERDPFENAVSSLVSALETDVGWVREHTRLGAIARRWDGAGRPARLLLRGADITDAETWRDARPREAPELTSTQSAFIAASRAGAGARQRTWIIGSLGAAAATAALAIFAYFQSVEADRQRGAAVTAAAEAERQRGVAEDNAAEAERQRVAAEDSEKAAEARRVEAQTTLAASRLTAGDRPGALAALLAADPDVSRAPRRALIAGLATPAQALEKVQPGAPFTLNGVLYLNHPDGPRPIDPFPARWWARAGDKPVMIGGAGALRLLSPDGETEQTANYETAFTPCFTEPVPEVAPGIGGMIGGVIVLGTTSHGYSACSVSTTAALVDEEDIYALQTQGACSDQRVRFFASGAPTFAVDEVFSLCAQGTPDQPALDAALGGAPAQALSRTAVVSYPAARSESALWTGQTDGAPGASAALMREAVAALPLDEDFKADLPVMRIPPDELSAFLLPDLRRVGDLTVLRAVTNWGGTGGELEVVCDARGDEALYCANYHHYSGMRGVTVAPDGRGYAVFGHRLDLDDGDDDYERHSAFWVEPGYKPFALWYLSAYGDILDFAISADGRRGAIVTATALATFELPDGASAPAAVSASTPPADAAAVMWDGAGGLIIAARDGGLWFQTDAGGWERREADPALSGDPDDFRKHHWLSRDEDGRAVAFGYGATFQVFDLSLRAPITGAATLANGQIGQRSRLSPRLSLDDDGGMRLTLNALDYRRAGAPPDADVARLLAADAPLAE